MGVRTLLMLARLLFAGLGAPAAPPDAPLEGQKIVFFGHPDRALVDERALLDAVAIYTRDLGLTVVQLPGKPPAGTGPAALDQLTALLRARGARLGFWCQPAPAGRSDANPPPSSRDDGARAGPPPARPIELVTVDSRRNVGHYLFDQEGPARADLYRSIALRLRAILVSADNPALATPAAAPPGPSPPPKTRPVPAPTPSAPEKPVEHPAARTPPPPPPAAAPVGPLAPAVPVSPIVAGAERRLFFGLGYALSSPIGASGGLRARNALALDVMLATGAHLEWDVGTDLSPSADVMSAGATTSVLDLPLRLGGRWVRPVRELLVGGGVFAGVHRLSATATAGSMTDQRAAYAGSFGLELMARGPVVSGFAPQLRLWVEANAPRTRFTVQGVPRYDVGPVRLGLTVEVAAPAR